MNNKDEQLAGRIVRPHEVPPSKRAKVYNVVTDKSKSFVSKLNPFKYLDGLVDFFE